MVISSEDGCDTRLIVPVAEVLNESVTVTANLKLPAVWNDPVRLPSEPRFKPGGSDPPGALQVYGGAPPVALSFCE